MPVMLETDVENERILKEFIEGDTIYQLVLEDKICEQILIDFNGLEMTARFMEELNLQEVDLTFNSIKN